MIITEKDLDREALAWIRDAHHHDRCARRQGKDCDCGRVALYNALLKRIQREARTPARPTYEEMKKELSSLRDTLAAPSSREVAT